MVRDILRPVFDKRFVTMLESKEVLQQTIRKSSWRSVIRRPFDQDTLQVPLIPDAAIHYRCGDNTVGHYGYLAFPAFKRRIPVNSTTIYVMAERSSRKTNAQRTSQCNAILNGLFEYLEEEFPSSSVFVLRGADMYDDMTRLALAKVTICSVSSFCIWPALSSTTLAYFPITRLIAKATAPTYTKNFKWLDTFPDEVVLPGVKSKRMDNSQILKFLRKPKGFRPSPPQYVLDRKRKIGNK